MGICGLLSFLDKSSVKTNVRQFSGTTVAIDSYCWLHKGAFSCAEKLSRDQPTDAYVRYCMKLVNMLLNHRIKPILVFDGRSLPAKAGTEVKRRESRDLNRRKAAELMQIGQIAEGRKLLKRSVDITHAMALELIKQCQIANIDCIVAPYEADAQLAYLNIKGIVDLVITEDSDLIMFGCKKVLFKMDMTGNGLLIDHSRLHLAMGVRSEHFDFEKFQYMCILSGCDYLPSLPGIGLQKARKFITMNTDCDIHRAISRLGSYLNMKSLVVPKEYRDAFIQALVTFKYQLIFCPLKRKQMRLNEPDFTVTEAQLYYAGEEVESKLAFQLALGNCDPVTFDMLHNFDPDEEKSQNQRIRTNSWTPKASPHPSIWSKHYQLTPKSEDLSTKEVIKRWYNTCGREIVIHTKLQESFKTHLRKPIVTDTDDGGIENGLYELSTPKLLETYETNNAMPQKMYNDIYMNDYDEESKSCINEEKLPKSIKTTNPFAKSTDKTETSPSLLHRARRRIKLRSRAQFCETVINEDVTESKYFSKLVDGRNDANETEKDNITSDEFINDTSQRQIHKKKDKEYDNICHMDVDEDNYNGSSIRAQNEVPENVCDDFDKQYAPPCSNDSSGYESGSIITSLCSDNAKVNSKIAPCNLVEWTSQSRESEFLVNQENIENGHSNLFNWTNTKTNSNTDRKLLLHKSRSLEKVTQKEKVVSNRIRKSKQVPPNQKQQTLLNMYGFQKKHGMTENFSS